MALAPKYHIVIGGLNLVTMAYLGALAFFLWGDGDSLRIEASGIGGVLPALSSFGLLRAGMLCERWRRK